MPDPVIDLDYRTHILIGVEPSPAWLCSRGAGGRTTVHIVDNVDEAIRNIGARTEVG
jgi:hypothetical protein